MLQINVYFFQGISPGGVYEAQFGDHYYNGRNLANLILID